MEQPEFEHIPLNARTGAKALIALQLYRLMLESVDPTRKFAQGMSLLEFLANPEQEEYMKFVDVKKVISRFCCSSKTERNTLHERFNDLTCGKGPTTPDTQGYRTRIVHLGETLEAILPNSADQIALLEEIDSYIRPALDHMIKHGGYSFEAYLDVRKKLKEQWM